MEKCVLIPDSFKGTMSSEEICTIMEKKVREYYPACAVLKIPVADGGEGTVDCFLTALGGEKISARVKGPFFEEIDAFYALIEHETVAVIEMASCAGLPLAEGRKDPKRATSYGVGQLILAAMEHGCQKIIIGLGGSCTNDGGAGMAAALGAVFLNRDGERFVPTGGTLDDITRIDITGLDPKISETEIVAMCDVDCPLCGEYGASNVFGPQKGADQETILLLDENLRHFEEAIYRDVGIHVGTLKGAGAAGGLGAGVVAFLGGKLEKGIDIVLDTVHFEELIQGSDFIFTGEGKIDEQSLHGKVVVGVAQRAKEWGIPVVAVVGDIGDGIGEAYRRGLSSVLSINNLAIPFQQARLRSREDLESTFDNLLRLIYSMEKRGAELTANSGSHTTG